LQIYKTTNIITNQIYIGKDVNDNPNYFGSGTYIKRALKKYGKENFIKEILDQCYSRDHLSFMECFWIKKYPECKVENGGYNIQDGGEESKHSQETILKMSMPVLQIDKNTGEVLKEWNSGTEAGKKLKIFQADICYVCLGKYKLAGDFIWVYKEDYSEEEVKRRIIALPSANSVAVLQVDRVTGDIIKEWNSGCEASRKLKIRQSNISRVCLNDGHLAGGFVWIYKKDYSEDRLNRKIKDVKNKRNDPKPKPVLQLDKYSGEFIKEWSSGTEAGRELNISRSHITQTCNGKEHSAGGFKWRYKDK